MAIDSLDDMQTLFRGIDLGDVSVSMTINAPAAIMLAYYVVAAEADVPADRLSGTIQADILQTSPRRSGASRSIRRCACSET